MLGIGLLLWTSCTKTGDQIANTVYSVGSSGTALDNMARGVNLSNWFNDFSNPAEYSNRFGTAHFQMIKQAGFTYVRLPIGPNVIMEGGHSSVLQPSNLTHIDNAVQRIIQAGLSVMLDFHPYTRTFESRLATDPSARNNFRLFWRNMANHFKKYDTAQVFFEIMNEPSIGATQAVPGIDVNWWPPVQEMAINAIREATPNHYIVAGAENYNNWYTLSRLFPYKVRNIVYNFHFYDPFVFTHQGASWVGFPYDQIKQLPYPANTGNTANMAAAASNSEIRNLINWEGRRQYNADSINLSMRVVYSWANQHKVPVICNEFGAYKPFVAEDGKIRYLRDVRNALVKYKIGWAVWDFDEGFGLSVYPNNRRGGLPSWEPQVLGALGMQ